MSKLKNSIKRIFFKNRTRTIVTSILAILMASLVGTCAMFSDHVASQLYLTIASWKGEPVIQQWTATAATDFHEFKDSVTSVTFLKEYNEESDTFQAKTAGPWDVSHAQDESVKAYMVGTDVYICANVGEPARIIANL